MQLSQKVKLVLEAFKTGKWVLQTLPHYQCSKLV